MEIDNEDELGFFDSDGEEYEEFDDDFHDTEIKIKYDKKTGQGAPPVQDSEEGGEVSGGGEEIQLFEVEEATGDAFLAVKPWIGAVFEPSQHNDPNPEKPDERYRLDYVFGYRADDSRDNLYYNKEGNIVYMTASLGVILDKSNNTQRFFGGIEVDNCEKVHAKDLGNHTDDVTSISVSRDRAYACSGQNGSTPICFVWNAVTGEAIKRFVLPKGSRSVDAIGFSEDCKYVATADNHNDHYVRVHEVKTGKQIFEQKSGNNKVFDLEWSKKPGHYEFTTCGEKHIMMWQPLEGVGKKGVYGSKATQTSHACVTYDEKGTAYSGGANSLIHCWRNRQLAKAYQVHESGFVGAIKVFNNLVFSGGRDGNIVISNPNTEQVERTVNVGALVRAIDYMDGNILVGTREGTIVEIDESDNIKTYMTSHSDGEVWGLALTADNRVITTGDDNKILVWSLDERKQVGQGTVSEVIKQAKKGGASTLSKLPPSQCSRAVAVNNLNGHVAIATNIGVISIRESADNLDSEVAHREDSAEWIEVLKYSPCGTMLAAGSHDNFIYVYDVENGYSKKFKCKGHTSYITSVDWSEDSSILRTV